MNIDDEHLKRVGRIAVEFGHLEWLLANIFMGLIGNTGEIVAEALDSVERRRRLTVKLMRERFPEMAEDWKTCVDEMGILQTKRNAIVHSAWLVNDGSDIIGVPGRGEAKAYSPGELDSVADSVRAINLRVTNFLGRIIAASMKD